MKVQNNVLAIKKLKWTSNFTDKNSLGNNLMIAPAKFEGVMTQIFTAKRYSDNPLTTMLNKMGATRTIDQTEWTWDLEGASSRPLVIVENLEASNTTPGKYKATFKIKLDEPWYLAGDVLHPGNPDAQVRVQHVLGQQGNGFVYVVRYMSDDPAAFLNPKYLITGTKWAKLYSQYGEASEQDGSTQFSMPIALKNRMSRYRKKYKITGDAANEVLAIKLAHKGKQYLSWIRYAEARYWEQWHRELERGAWYSKTTNTILDDNGRPIASGPGVQEQLKNSNIQYYSVLTVKLIEEYLMDIFYGRVKPGTGRDIKAFTGEYGMLIFHNAVQAWMEKGGFIKNVAVFTDKVQSEYTSKGLEGGYQFVKYTFANGGSLELIHNPLYDDRDINFEIDPVSGYPIESQRFTFLDFSSGGVDGNNIEWVDKQNGFKVGYIQGLHNPFGPTANQAMAHAGDWYSMHCQKQFGIHIQDITKCGELILRRS